MNERKNVFQLCLIFYLKASQWHACNIQSDNWPCSCKKNTTEISYSLVPHWPNSEDLWDSSLSLSCAGARQKLLFERSQRSWLQVSVAYWRSIMLHQSHPGFPFWTADRGTAWPSVMSPHILSDGQSRYAHSNTHTHTYAYTPFPVQRSLSAVSPHCVRLQFPCSESWKRSIWFTGHRLLVWVNWVGQG